MRKGTKETSPPFPCNAIRADTHHPEPLSQTICIYKMSDSHLQFLSLLPDLNTGCLISNASLREFLGIDCHPADEEPAPSKAVQCVSEAEDGPKSSSPSEQSQYLHNICK